MYKGYIQVIVAVILSAILLPFGLIYGILVKPTYLVITAKATLKQGFVISIKYAWNFISQIWKTIERLCHYIGVVLDLAGNVIVGDLIEDIITDEEETLFGEGDATISAATGELEVNNKTIYKIGKVFSNVLNKVFREEAHCTDAYKAHLQWKNYK